MAAAIAPARTRRRPNPMFAPYGDVKVGFVRGAGLARPHPASTTRRSAAYATTVPASHASPGKLYA